MPESRFVSARRLRPLLVYLTAAVVVLLVFHVLIGGLTEEHRVRRIVAVAWVVLLPIGGWIVWRRS